MNEATFNEAKTRAELIGVNWHRPLSEGFDHLANFRQDVTR